jgi:hypothetical protein
MTRELRQLYTAVMDGNATQAGYSIQMVLAITRTVYPLRAQLNE